MEDDRLEKERADLQKQFEEESRKLKEKEVIISSQFKTWNDLDKHFELHKKKTRITFFCSLYSSKIMYLVCNCLWNNFVNYS